MPQTDKYIEHKQKYLCSNPNCRRVFSRPKIIRYYVCPTCQTLVDMTKTDGKAGTEGTPTTPESVIRRRPKLVRALIIEPEKSREIETTNLQATSVRPAAKEFRTPMEEVSKVNEKIIMLEQVHASQAKNMELTSTQAPAQAIETRTASSSSSGCQYGYGYLGQREKGEGIPDICIECPKSLSCMLSEYYKKEDSVKEIKKWYEV